MSDLTTLDIHGSVAVIRTDSPPVNALAAPVRAGLLRALQRAEADPAVQAIVLTCAGRTFHAGADIHELASGPVSPTLQDVLLSLEGTRKIVVAALHGTTLGGGLELALTADYRIAADASTVGLPEVLLGLIPGAGGTQRLPRAAGVAVAVDLITSGRQMSALDAQQAGIIDRVVPSDQLTAAAIDWAQALVAHGAPRRRLSDDSVPGSMTDNLATLDAVARQPVKPWSRLDAPQAACRALHAAITQPFAEGVATERAEFLGLLKGSQSRALRHLFFAERAVAKSRWISASAVGREWRTLGIVGAGTMGSGIALSCLNAGLSVHLVENHAQALERGLSTIRGHYESRVATGKLSAEAAAARLTCLTTTTDLASLADCDLVIEAIYENMEAKLELFRQLDALCKPDAILASNTSYLNIDAMAAVTTRPSQVLGLHFFSPAHVNRLLEIIRTEHVSESTLASAMAWSKRIKKLGVVVGNAHGFVGNRMLAPRQREADKLILEGALPWEVDRVLEAFGLPMGPFRMRDLAGMDIGWNPATTASATVRERLCEIGRLGQKTKAGYYDYDDQRRATPSNVAQEVVLRFSAEHGYVRRAVSETEILERCLYPMINEGARLLAEGIAERASDIDMVWTTGYGWPTWTGGPMHWAETVGWATIVERLEVYAALYGAEFTPCDALRQWAAPASQPGV